MATNEILRFCETDTKSNVLTQAEYETDSERMIGNQPGVARAKFVNKVLRQTSAVAAGVGQFIADAGLDCNDSQTPAVIASNLQAGVTRWGRAPAAAAKGTAAALLATFDYPLQLIDGQAVLVRAAFANTGAVTLNANGLGARAVYKDNNTPLAAGDIKGAGQWLELVYDGTLGKWCLTNPYISPSLDLAKIWQSIYPIGTIYQTLDSGFDPNVSFSGTTWTRLKDGLFLESASTASQIGQELAAGLPNIMGTYQRHLGAPGFYGAVGAFYLEDKQGGGASVTDNSTYVRLCYSASRSSSIYGNSTTVQPPAILVAMWQRTA